MQKVFRTVSYNKFGLELRLLYQSQVAMASDWSLMKLLLFSRQVMSICFSEDFPGGPEAKSLCYQCRGPKFDPWSGNQIPGLIPGQGTQIPVPQLRPNAVKKKKKKKLQSRSSTSIHIFLAKVSHRMMPTC